MPKSNHYPREFLLKDVSHKVEFKENMTCPVKKCVYNNTEAEKTARTYKNIANIWYHWNLCHWSKTACYVCKCCSHVTPYRKKMNNHLFSQHPDSTVAKEKWSRKDRQLKPVPKEDTYVWWMIRLAHDVVDPSPVWIDFDKFIEAYTKAWHEKKSVVSHF